MAGQTSPADSRVCGKRVTHAQDLFHTHLCLVCCGSRNKLQVQGQRPGKSWACALVFHSLHAEPVLHLLLEDHLSYVLTVLKQPKRCIRSVDKMVEMSLQNNKLPVERCWRRAGQSHHQLQMLQLSPYSISQCAFPALESQAKKQHAPECHDAVSQTWCLNSPAQRLSTPRR